MVEFALLFPLFVIIVMGTIDFGFLINRNTVLNNAAREGARVAIFDADAAAVETRVRDVAGVLDQDDLSVSVTCRAADGTDCPGVSFADEWERGGTVVVVARYEYDYMTPITNISGLGSSRELTSTIEMRIEG